MLMYKIQVVGSFTADEEARLRAAAGEAEIRFCSDAEVSAELLKDADALIGNPPLAMAESAENLKWMQLLSSGADAYAGSRVLKDRGLVLTTATGAYGVGIAEYMVAMLLAMMKKLPGYYDLQKAAQWRDLGAVVSARATSAASLQSVCAPSAVSSSACAAERVSVRRSSTGSVC